MVDLVWVGLVSAFSRGWGQVLVEVASFECSSSTGQCYPHRSLAVSTLPVQEEVALQLPG
jgi:hypothetical protein